jgi:hypothetical protein
MSVLLSNYSSLTSGFQLANSSDVIANSYSLIEGNDVVNIKDLILAAGSTIDAYTKAETDAALLLKQNNINWITGDSNGINTISTGEGALSIALPGVNGTFTDAIRIKGPNTIGEEGQATFYNKVIMNEALEVSGGITMGGLSVLTTGTAYTKDETFTQSQTNNLLSQALAYTAGEVTELQTQIAVGPFWCAGKINGNTLEKLASRGITPFTCTRVAGQNSGAFYIAFDSPLPSAHYIVHLTNQETGNMKVWSSSPPTVNGFTIIVFDGNDTLANSTFYFSVIA